jgi:hypothetical protein
MVSRIEKIPAMPQNNAVAMELSPSIIFGDPKEQDTIFMGWGACKSCGCTGYVQGGAGYQNCKACSHHFSQHK